MLNAFQRLNWLDLVVIILLFRIGYIAVEKGLVTEIFKNLGIFAAIILSCHYYTILGGFVSSKVPLPVAISNVFSFIVLSIFGYLIFTVLRNVVLQLVKKEPKSPLLSKWLGGCLGICRWFLTIGLLVLILNISLINYLSTSIRESFLASHFLKVVPAVYGSVWNGLVSKINPEAPSNPAIFQIVQ